MANSSMTFTYDEGADHLGRHCCVRKVIVNWLSDDTDGSCTGTSKKIVGRLVKGVTDPGSDAPTDNYDITLTDEEGVNILGNVQSTLIDRDTVNSEEVYFLVKDAAGTPLAQSIHPIVCDMITVTIANAGNAKTGQIILYYEES